MEERREFSYFSTFHMKDSVSGHEQNERGYTPTIIMRSPALSLPSPLAGSWTMSWM